MLSTIRSHYYHGDAGMKELVEEKRRYLSGMFVNFPWDTTLVFPETLSQTSRLLVLFTISVPICATSRCCFIVFWRCTVLKSSLRHLPRLGLLWSRDGTVSLLQTLITTLQTVITTLRNPYYYYRAPNAAPNNPYYFITAQHNPYYYPTQSLLLLQNPYDYNLYD